MYFSCQEGNFLAAKIVIFLGLRGSKFALLPLASLRTKLASEERMLEEVERT